MKKLQSIIETLVTIKISNERLYNMVELMKQIKNLTNSEIVVDDCILTPYYVNDGKMYEFYDYELSINIVSEKDFNKHLLKLTGRNSIDEIPFSIISRQKKCHIEIFKEEENLGKHIIENYLNFVMNSSELQKTVVQVFGGFVKEKLFFELY